MSDEHLIAKLTEERDNAIDMLGAAHRREVDLAERYGLERQGLVRSHDELYRTASEFSDRAVIAESERDRYREALGRYMSGEDSRAQRLRLKLFQMRDAREVTSAAGYTLTTEAKAKLYDIQQDIIRAAIEADDRACTTAESEPSHDPG